MQSSVIQKRTLIILLAVLTFSTIIYTRLFIYETLTNKLLFFPLALAVVLYAGIKLLSAPIHLRKHSFNPLLLFALWGAYIALHALFISKEFNVHSCYLIISILLYFSLTILFSKTGVSFRWLYIVMMSAASFEAIVCLAQYIGVMQSHNSLFQVTGNQVNPNTSAMFLAMGVPACLYMILWDKGKLKSAAMVAIILLGLALLTLKCRTALLGACLGLFLLLNNRYTIVKRLKESKSRFFTSAVLIVAVVIPAAFHMYKSKQASADGRSLVYKISLQMFLEKPLTGFGYGLFEPNYNQHQAAYFAKGGSADEAYRAGYINMAYNEALENAVQGGILGLLLPLGTVISLAAVYIRKYRTVNKIPAAKKKTKPGASMPNPQMGIETAAFAGIVAFSLMSLVNFTLQASSVWLAFIFYAVVITNNPGEEAQSAKRRWLPAKLEGSILIASVLIVVYFPTGYLLGHLKLKNAETIFTRGDKAGTLQILKDLERPLAMSESYHQFYGSVLFSNNQYRQALQQFNLATRHTSNSGLHVSIGSCYEKLDSTSKAGEHYKLAMNMEPGRFLPRYRLMKLYAAVGDTLHVKEMAAAIVQLKPKIMSNEVAFYKSEAMKEIKKYEVQSN